MANKPDVARMRWELQWQRNNPTSTGFGSDTQDSWQTIATVYAEVVPKGGSEVDNAKQRKAIVNYEINMRNVGVIKPLDRFLWSTVEADGTSVTHTLNIKSVYRVDGRNAYLKIDATEQL